MHDFHYKGDELFCEEVSIQNTVEQVGTPCYIYSHRTINRHFHAFDDAFKGYSAYRRLRNESQFQHCHLEALSQGRQWG